MNIMMKPKIEDSSSSSSSSPLNQKPTIHKKAATTKVGPRKKKWKKPKDKPKRPLSAYNIFFRFERAKLLCSYNKEKTKFKKVGFAALAKHIAPKWKTLDAESRKVFEVQAGIEQVRYKKELEEWKRKQQNGDSDTASSDDSRASPVPSLSSENASQASQVSSPIVPMKVNGLSSQQQQPESLSSMMDQNMVSVLLNSLGGNEVQTRPQEQTLDPWYSMQQPMQPRANGLMGNGPLPPPGPSPLPPAPWMNSAAGQQQQQQQPLSSTSHIMPLNVRPQRVRSLPTPTVTSSMPSTHRHLHHQQPFAVSPDPSYNYQDEFGLENNPTAMLEFGDIISDIANMDSDPVPVESSSSHLPPSLPSPQEKNFPPPLPSSKGLVRSVSLPPHSPVKKQSEKKTKENGSSKQLSSLPQPPSAPTRVRSSSVVEQDIMQPSSNTVNVAQDHQRQRRSMSMPMTTTASVVDSSIHEEETLDVVTGGTTENLDELYNFLKNDTDLFQC